MKRVLRRLLVLAALAACLATAGLAWLLYTEAGLRWALERAVEAAAGRLTLAGASGTLGGGVALERASWAEPGLRVAATRVRAQARAFPLLRGRIGIEPLSVDVLRIEVADAGPSAGVIAMPIGLRVADARVDRFELVVRGATQRFERLNFTHIAVGPRALRAGGSFVRPDARWPIVASLELKGDLHRFEANVAGSVAGVATQATLAIEPQAPLPVRTLEARAGPANPATLQAGLPRATVSAWLRARASDEGYTGELALENAAPAKFEAGGVPLSAARTQFASRGFEHARLTALRLQMPGGGALEGGGELDASGLRVTLEARKLDLRALRADLRQTSLAGRLELGLNPERQSVRGRLFQEDFSVETDVARAGELVEVRSLHARAAGGEVKGSGRLRFGERIAIQAKLRVERFDPAAFGDFPRGEIHGRLEADGLLGEAPSAYARWTIERSTLAGQALESRGRARFAADRVTQLDAQARYGPTRLGARGAFGRGGDRLELTLAVDELATLHAELHGRLAAQGTLTGGWENPALRASASIPDLRLPGDDKPRAARATFDGTRQHHQLTLRFEAPGSVLRARLAGEWLGEKGWQGEVLELENAGTYPMGLLAPAPLAFARDRVELGKLEARVASGRVLVQELRWSPGRLATRGEARGLPLAWLVLAAGEAERLRATMLVEGDWQLEAREALAGRLRLRRESGDLALRAEGEELPLEFSAAELELRFGESGAVLEGTARSRFGALSLQGTVGHAPGRPALGYGPASPLALRTRIESEDLRALTEPFVTQARIVGRLSADLSIEGTLAAPEVLGDLRATGIGFEVPAYGVYLSKGQLQARLERDHLRVASLSIRGGNGEFAASGSLPFDPAAGDARLRWTARKLDVLSRRDLRLTVSGDGEVALNEKRVLLTGALRADHGYLLIVEDSLPRPGSDVVVVGQAPAPQSGQPRVPLALDVTLDLGNDLTIETQTMEGKLAGEARVATGHDGRLRAYGRLRAVNAIFHAYGQRLQVDPGELFFDGPLDNPALNITAWRRNQAVEAGVQITGNLKTPRVQIVSNPPVGDAERLSWLVLGRAPGEATQADLGLLQAAAGSLFARGNSLPADRRIARAFGIDEIGLRGGGELQSSVVAVGKRVSDRLYVSYEQGIGAVATSLVKLDYALGRRWSLRGEAGTTSGAGLFYRFSWD
jgi:translocation and assembly module TamB